MKKITLECYNSGANLLRISIQLDDLKKDAVTKAAHSTLFNEYYKSCN